MIGNELVKRALLGLVFGLLVVSGRGDAQGPKKQKAGAESARKAVDSRTEKILGLDWHSSIEGAIAMNDKNPRDQRPILFMRVLGDLRGKT